jgi:hypothetical protein
MSQHAQAHFTIAAWDEQTWDGRPARDVTGAKLTRAQVRYTYQGVIAGEGTVQYLMAYRDDGSANFVGLEQVVGSIAGHAGSFVLQHTGSYDKHTVTENVVVLPGSGTGELQGLRGAGRLELPEGQQPPFAFALEYTFE